MAAVNAAVSIDLGHIRGVVNTQVLPNLPLGPVNSDRPDSGSALQRSLTNRSHRFDGINAFLLLGVHNVFAQNRLGVARPVVPRGW